MGIFTLPKKVVEAVPGRRLAYAEEGPAQAMSNPVLLFVPGFTFSGEVFGHQLEALSEKYRVIALDPRSHGASTVTGTGNHYAAQAEDLRGFIEALDLDRIVLIGWSFGALATWGYSALDMERLAAHVCVDMPPVPLSDEPGAWVEGKIAEVAPIYRALMSTEGQASFVRDYARHAMVQRQLADEELNWLVSLSLRTPCEVAASLLASGLFSDCLEVAQALERRIPSRFYIADHWRDRAESYLDKHLPTSSRVVFGRHMMFWEHPERFNRDLDEYVQSL